MKKSVRTQAEEIQAMDVIINIQTMQKKIYGKLFDHNDFNGNSLDELYELQSSLIPEWNKTFVKN